MKPPRPLTGLLMAGAVVLAVQSFVSGAVPYSVDWPLLVVTFGATIIVPAGLEAVRRHLAVKMNIRPFLFLAAWPGMAWSSCREPGWLTALLALPWLLVTTTIAWQAAAVFCRSPRTFARAVTLSGPVMLAVGGAWYFADRAGWEAFGFDFLVVRLTAAHFHFAGFTLPIAVGLLLEHWKRPAALLNLMGAGVLAGVPLVAAGITLTRMGAPLEWECAIAAGFSVCAGAAGLAQATLALRSREQRAAVRALLAFSGLCLAAGMALALLYAMRPWITLTWLHLPRMWAVHGSIQAFGFALPAMSGWLLWAIAPHISLKCVPDHRRING